MHIDTDFEGGSIEVLDADDPTSIELALRADTAADIRQWFYFHAHGARGEACAFRIGNAGAAKYPGGWGEGYRACASYDGERWFRVPTAYDGAALTFQHTPEHDACAYACFAPYPDERRRRLIEWATWSQRMRHVALGHSVHGRPLDALVFGHEGRGLRRVWIVARQHPGEAMAAWFMEGLVARLLDAQDPIGDALQGGAVLYLVPGMNPDGVVLANHRTNAAGRDLNREWLAPSEELSPEVFHVRRAILDGGVDLFLDVHGEETLPYVFAAACEGIPDYTERLKGLEDMFASHLAGVDPDFQREHGYDRDPPGQADLRLASNFIGQRCDCLSLTLEMPFKDNVNRPNEETGWSPERSAGFGSNTLESVLACLGALR